MFDDIPIVRIIEDCHGRFRGLATGSIHDKHVQRHLNKLNNLSLIHWEAPQWKAAILLKYMVFNELKTKELLDENAKKPFFS